MIQYLAESENFKVYSFYENVYLKNKSTSININKLDDNDLLIADHYGDPNNALILPNEKYIVVSGCGLSIFDVQNQNDKHILNDPDKIVWTNGLHQHEQDDLDKEVRFVASNDKNQLRVFKIDLINTIITEME